MSETPRTDAATDKYVWPNSADNFARQLERELRESEASAAVMREALNAIPFPCPCCSYSTMHAGDCVIGIALSTNAGRELLEKVAKLQREHDDLCSVADMMRPEREVELLAEVERLRDKHHQLEGTHSTLLTALEFNRKERGSLRRKLAAADGMERALKECLAADHASGLSVLIGDKYRKFRSMFTSAESALAAWQEANKL